MNRSDNIPERHREIWNNKKILRIIYEDWYKKIIGDLSGAEGKTLELGSGSGNFKSYKPDIISSDIDKCDWLDMAFDAHDMPFENEFLSNTVMIDVLHHLSNPVLFLNEAFRTLKSGGRVIMLEPFPSPFSLMIYKRYHPEPFIFETDYFSLKETKSKDPWESNQAIPYLLFYKHRNKFNQYFSGRYKIIKAEKLSYILYPASGGFENKQMIPDFLIPAFQLGEKILSPLKSLLAFRCYTVLEKI